MAEPFTIYKLTILYMLETADAPLSNTQISHFFLEQDYTDYFHVQEALSELQDAELLSASSTHRNTQYFLTPSGKDTLHLSLDKLNGTIRSDIRKYLDTHQIQIRSENSATAFYYRNPDFNYSVCCRLFAQEQLMLELTVTVPDLPQAQTVCQNWEKQSGPIYHSIIEQLY